MIIINLSGNGPVFWQQHQQLPMFICTRFTTSSLRLSKLFLHYANFTLRYTNFTLHVMNISLKLKKNIS